MGTLMQLERGVQYNGNSASIRNLLYLPLILDSINGDDSLQEMHDPILRTYMDKKEEASRESIGLFTFDQIV